jgi:hypothetical protein
MEMNGWLKAKERVLKKKPSTMPTVDLDFSFAGEDTISVIVSRMEVRLGMMKAPLEVVSQ